MKEKKYKPLIEKGHNSGDGIHKVYRFPNDYGASVVRFKTLNPHPIFGMMGSYTDENTWELAVIKFFGEGVGDYELTYDTKITDDVLGYLTDEQVEKTLAKIEKLKRS